MSTQPRRRNQSIVPEDADSVTTADLVEIVADLEETIEEQQETIDDQADTIEEQQETIEQLARDNAETKQRVTALEEADSGDKTPTPDGSETGVQESLTPIERLSDGDREDIAHQVTPSVERALCLHENLEDWGSKTPKGVTLRPADKPKDLLEAATGESLAWQQYYRACEALESLSKGAVTFVDTKKHGKTLVMHEQTETNSGRSQSMLAAD